MSAATASGMFTRCEYLARVAGDRKASDAPMSAFPAAAVTAIARLPARPLPKGGCAFPVSNDNVALTRLRPPRGQQGLGGPRPLLCSSGKQKMNRRGTNRRPLDVI